MHNLHIPSKIKAGYQNRKGTYTGKLAYVIYYDQKGKLRKETSWNSWCDSSIDSNEFDNVPTDGFVLNKCVGGARQSYGWNTRNEYIRVYDPRGFEFEISVNNLLFILQECTSTKGKGLEGKFVYSWLGSDLILMPVSSVEYQQSMDYTTNLSKKVTKDQMHPGRTYLDKNGDELIYLGRESCHKLGFSHYGSDYDKVLPLLEPAKHKFHVFYNIKNVKYEFHTGFTKLASVIDEDTNVEFLDVYEQFSKSIHMDHITSCRLQLLDYSLFNKPVDSRFWGKCFFEYENKWYSGKIANTSNGTLIANKWDANLIDGSTFSVKKEYFEKDEILDICGLVDVWSGRYSTKDHYIFDLTFDEFCKQVKPYYLEYVLSSNETIKSGAHYVR